MNATYEFTLVLSGTFDFEEISECIYAGGCNDATVAECRGTVVVEFMREADTFEEAMLSAICQLRGLGVKVSRVEPDNLVNENEIARRIGQSRQSVNQYVSADRGPGGFPSPAAILTGKRCLWHWHEVVTWLVTHRMWGTPHDADQAESIAMANAALEVLRHQSRSHIFETLKQAA